MPRTGKIYMSSQQGRRSSNEDVEQGILNLGSDGRAIKNNMAPIDLFIVCDGHGGIEVAEYVVPKLITRYMNKKLQYPLTKQQINKMYNEIETELENHPKQIGLECGCTALVVVRFTNDNKEYLQVINLGDCRAVMPQNGLAIALNKDHKPYWPDEKKRIDSVNKKYKYPEEIIFDEGDWRVQGLSVSRAFGDINAKPHISHIPDSYVYKLNDSNDFLIVACDGLWDILQNHEAVNFVSDHFDNNNIQFYNLYDIYPSKDVSVCKNIARKLASYAIARGSTDNVSVLIIKFT